MHIVQHAAFNLEGSSLGNSSGVPVSVREGSKLLKVPQSFWGHVSRARVKIFIKLFVGCIQADRSWEPYKNACLSPHELGSDSRNFLGWILPKPLG